MTHYRNHRFYFYFLFGFFLTYCFASRKFKVIQYSFINTTRLHSNTHLQLHSVQNLQFSSCGFLWNFFQSVTFPFSIVTSHSAGYHKWRFTRMLYCKMFLLCWLLSWQEINHLLHSVWDTDGYGQHSSTTEALFKRIYFSTF